MIASSRFSGLTLALTTGSLLAWRPSLLVVHPPPPPPLLAAWLPIASPAIARGVVGRSPAAAHGVAARPATACESADVARRLLQLAARPIYRPFLQTHRH
ncbi:hypothetical protein NL676_004808 [Syzygium grande]|nr:hypothetical protein NL676_004808 [Syzygium grande]